MNNCLKRFYQKLCLLIMHLCEYYTINFVKYSVPPHHKVSIDFLQIVVLRIIAKLEKAQTTRV